MKQPVKIWVDLSTRQALNTLKRGGESQDAVIRRLIVFWIKHEREHDPEVLKELLDIEEEVTE